MKLSDISPKETNFEIRGLKLTFRAFTIGDDLKANEICGAGMTLGDVFANLASKELNEILNAFEKISLISWYQLTLESQRQILNIKELVFLDPETGEEKRPKLSPIEKFRNLFADPADQSNLFTAFLRCRGLNIPDLKDKEAVKNWNDQLTKLLPSIGR
jgi:hypothetical protein